MVAVARVGSVRSLAEKLFAPLVLVRHLPKSAGGGKVVVSTKVGGLKCVFKRAEDWDPELLRVAELLVKKNDVVWDVGANIGLFSKCASYFAGAEGHVYSMEADTDVQVLLHRSISFSLPEEAPITLLPVAVSDQVGWETFSISKRARASNSLLGYGSSSTGGVLQNRTVPAVSLDSLLDQFLPPKVLKIDVEGAELKVIKGGDKILKAIRPLIYCEIASENTLEVEKALCKHSYRYVDGRKFSSIAEMSQIGNSIGFNTVAVPEELIS